MGLSRKKGQGIQGGYGCHKSLCKHHPVRGACSGSRDGFLDAQHMYFGCIGPRMLTAAFSGSVAHRKAQQIFQGGHAEPNGNPKLFEFKMA